MLKALQLPANDARAQPDFLTPSHCTQRILRREAEHLALCAHEGGDPVAGAKATWLFALLEDVSRRC